MKMSICLLIILLGVVAAEKPASSYGVPKPVATYKPKPVATYKPQAHRPVVYQIAPHHGGKFSKTGGKLAKTGAKLAKTGGKLAITGGKLAGAAAKTAPIIGAKSLLLGAKAGVAKAVLLGWG